MKLAKGSWSLVLSFLSCIVILGILGIFIENRFIKWIVLFFFVLFILIEAFFLLFFRDPDRIIGEGVVAAADGVIHKIDYIVDEELGDSLCISTFMNIYHVHVNRIPVDGTIEKIIYIPGGHVPAFKKDSERNERMITVIQTKNSPVKIIQIAGILARRIVCYISSGQYLKKGTRIGIIRFGSRVDLIIPKRNIKHIMVKKGDHVRAGETQIAKIQ